MLKYADDSYLMIPSSYAATVKEESDHVEKRAETCKLKLKLNKSKVFEMLIRSRSRVAKGWSQPTYLRFRSG